MNIKLKLNIKEGTLKDVNGNDIIFSNEIEKNLFISPLYATENDILRVFMDDNSSYENLAQELAFEGSLKADKYIKANTVSTKDMSAQDIALLKREYVICHGAYHFGKTFFKDYLKSVSKSKFLADVKVSIDVEKDPFVIKLIAQDAKDCMDNIQSLSSFGMASFSKGSTNSCNKSSSREWMPNLGGGYPQNPIAAGSLFFFCKKYKIGAK